MKDLTTFLNEVRLRDHSGPVSSPTYKYKVYVYICGTKYRDYMVMMSPDWMFGEHIGNAGLYKSKFIVAVRDGGWWSSVGAGVYRELSHHFSDTFFDDITNKLKRMFDHNMKFYEELMGNLKGAQISSRYTEELCVKLAEYYPDVMFEPIEKYSDLKDALVECNIGL